VLLLGQTYKNYWRPECANARKEPVAHEDDKQCLLGEDPCLPHDCARHDRRVCPAVGALAVGRRYDRVVEAGPPDGLLFEAWVVLFESFVSIMPMDAFLHSHKKQRGTKRRQEESKSDLDRHKEEKEE